MTAVIRTRRLELRPARVADLEAELAGRSALEERLGVRVPADWPPELYDEAALRYALDMVREAGGGTPWGMYYMVATEPRVVVGVCGYKGPPDADGSVELGYSVVREFRRRGFATEATGGLVLRAFAEPSVTRVLAETLTDLAPSIGVLEKLGFRFSGVGSEAGVIRYEFTRGDLANADLAFGA